MTAQLLPPGQITFFDDDGKPLSNGLVYFYIPSTTTFKNTWQDRGQLSLNTNPVQLDAAGRATIWGDGVYRQRVFDELGNEIWDKIVSTVDTSNNTGASGYYGGFTAVGGETSFSLVNQDGDSFTVAAGAEVTLGIYINGVKLELENYSTDGSDLVTLINSTTLVAGDLVYYEQTGGINLNVPGPGSITSAEQFGTTVTFTGRTLSGGTLMGQTITNAVLSGTTTLPGAGQISSGGNLTITGTAYLGGAAGTESLRVTPTASAVNYFNVTGGVTGFPTQLGSAGSDTNVNLAFVAKGSADHRFYTTSYGNEQFRISHTASAANYWGVTGSTTGNRPNLYVGGSDTNITGLFNAKGTGGFLFTSGGGSAYPQFAISNTTSAVNYWSFTGATTGNNPSLTATGTDSNIGLTLNAKGTSRITLAAQTIIDHATYPGLYFRVSGMTTGVIASSSSLGLALASNSTNPIAFNTSGGEQFRIAHTASATRYITVTGSNGGNPAISVSGGELAVGTNAWTFGVANVVSPTSPNRTLTITIGGTTYYIAAKTTND